LPAAQENRLKQIIIDELGVDEREVRPGAHLIRDLGADSLDCVNLVMRVEKEFSINISDEDAEKIQFVRDLYAYLERRLRQDNMNARPSTGTTNSTFNNRNVGGAGGLLSNTNVPYAVNTNMSGSGNMNMDGRPRLSIEAREAGDVVILDMSGVFPDGEETLQLRRMLADLLNKRKRKFIVNLKNLDLLDSRGTSALASSVQLVSRVRGQLKLLSPGTKVRGMLAAAGLSNSFEIYEDEPAAIAAFKTDESCVVRGARPEKVYATRREVEEIIRRVMADTLGVSTAEVIPAANVQDDLNADSLEKIELTVRLEEEFCLDIPDEEVAGFQLVSNYNKYIWLRVRQLPS
jgi:acyl carrier protein